MDCWTYREAAATIQNTPVGIRVVYWFGPLTQVSDLKETRAFLFSTYTRRVKMAAYRSSADGQHGSRVVTSAAKFMLTGCIQATMAAETVCTRVQGSLYARKVQSRHKLRAPPVPRGCGCY